MSETQTVPAARQTIEAFDVLIVGAGISGIGGAYHLTKQCPGTSFVVLETLESFGGTWLTHRYPGTRSDSDLYTFGYRFKPWTSAPIATRAEIMTYLAEVMADNGLAGHIRYGHRVLRAAWSSEDKNWAIEVVRASTGRPSGSPPISCGCARGTIGSWIPTRRRGRGWAISRAPSSTR